MFLSWLRNGRTVERALVTPAETPSDETLEARLAALISFYRWQDAVHGVPVAKRLLQGRPAPGARTRPAVPSGCGQRRRSVLAGARPEIPPP